MTSPATHTVSRAYRARRTGPTRRTDVCVLDSCLQRIRDGRAEVAVEFLLASMARIRASQPEGWAVYRETCRRHPLWDVVRLDPFIARAFDKPRGYAGDAALIDLIYRVAAPRFDTGYGDLPRRLHLAFTDTPPCRAVRARLHLVTRELDALDARNPGARVLSVAAGHAREAGASRALRDRRFSEFVALDQDAASLATLERDYGHLGLRPVAGSVRDLLGRRGVEGSFDFIYSMGLFDYLDQRTATRLVARLFDRLRPGGRLLIGNFVDDLPSAGFMEAFMDWNLVYRSDGAMLGLTGEIGARQAPLMRLFREENENIVFLEVEKR